jgi:predicted ArsR family transcriptional regulator
VAEAAEALGITAEAVRSRIKRRTLRTIREGGTVYVVLGDTDRARPVGDRARPGDEPPSDRTDALIDALGGQVEDLREQLHAERQAHAEARRIIAGLVERIPAIEAPSDERDAPETVEQEPGGHRPRSDAPGPQEGTERRPWWRRVFRGQ